MRRHSSATHKSSTRCIVLGVCECPLSALNYAEVGMRMASRVSVCVCVWASGLSCHFWLILHQICRNYFPFFQRLRLMSVKCRAKTPTVVQLCATRCRGTFERCTLLPAFILKFQLPVTQHCLPFVVWFIDMLASPLGYFPRQAKPCCLSYCVCSVFFFFFVCCSPPNWCPANNLFNGSVKN